MGLIDAMGMAAKLVIGTIVGGFLILAAILAAGFASGTAEYVIALIMLIIGAGFILWGRGA